MPRSIRFMSASFLGLLLGLGLTACVGGDCYGGIGATISAPVLPVRGGQLVGACPQWVDIDGENWTQSAYRYDLEPAELQPIGEARRVGLATTPLANLTIYAIDGLDPDEVVALRAADGEMLVFNRNMGWSGTGMPVELCDRLADYSPAPPACE